MHVQPEEAAAGLRAAYNDAGFTSLCSRRSLRLMNVQHAGLDMAQSTALTCCCRTGGPHIQQLPAAAAAAAPGVRAAAQPAAVVGCAVPQRPHSIPAPPLVLPATQGAG
jgi:hypothetical protein